MWKLIEGVLHVDGELTEKTIGIVEKPTYETIRWHDLPLEKEGILRLCAEEIVFTHSCHWYRLEEQ